jgi:hypothetical protein
MPFPFPSGTILRIPSSVFVFLTLLYRGDTLQLDDRINHKSPVSGQFGKIFP